MTEEKFSFWYIEKLRKNKVLDFEMINKIKDGSDDLGVFLDFTEFLNSEDLSLLGESIGIFYKGTIEYFENFSIDNFVNFVRRNDVKDVLEVYVEFMLNERVFRKCIKGFLFVDMSFQGENYILSKNTWEVNEDFLIVEDKTCHDFCENNDIYIL